MTAKAALSLDITAFGGPPADPPKPRPRLTREQLEVWHRRHQKAESRWHWLGQTLALVVTGDLTLGSSGERIARDCAELLAVEPSGARRARLFALMGRALNAVEQRQRRRARRCAPRCVHGKPVGKACSECTRELADAERPLVDVMREIGGAP